jgi:uncharacterized membrane protein
MPTLRRANKDRPMTEENPILLPPLKKPGLFSGLRASFLTGLVVVLPVGLTIYVIWTVVGWIDSWILPLIPGSWQPDALLRDYFGEDFQFSLRGVGVIVFLIFTIIVGWIAKGLIGRSMINRAEGLVNRMPLVSSVYTGIKQIAETVFAKTEKNFDRTCLVQFPRPGVWAVGFVAAKPKGEIASRLPNTEDMVTVFIALTPLTSGFLVYVPARDVIMLDMTLEEAFKLVISAGLVYPNGKPVTPPLLTN